jgi:signal transduction histidine kinase
VVVGAFVVGLVVDALLVRTEERRLGHVADQVVAFASDEQRPPPLTVDGGRQWQRMITALNDIARVLRERFEALRAERARVERLLDVMPTAVLLFTADGLAYANPQAHRMFELEEPAGLTPLRALGDKALEQAVDEAAETGRSVTVEVRRDDRQLSAHATRIAPTEIALVVTDLTDVRRVEAMRRDFVANASHELKTPVTGMQALADSLHLAMERDPDRARSMVERIQHEATRLARLVRDLLDLTRLEERADDRTRQRVDLHELCAVQVERLRLLAEREGVDLVLRDSDHASVIGIPDDLKLITGNLIQNGIQYNAEGGVVTVGVSRRGSMAVIEVADSGIGIPEAEQDRIFERFYRVDKARSRQAGGTGLGLSLVRNAVERHGGAVRVSSVLGEGSTFTVELPVDGGMG